MGRVGHSPCGPKVTLEALLNPAATGGCRPISGRYQTVGSIHRSYHITIYDSIDTTFTAFPNIHRDQDISASIRSLPTLSRAPICFGNLPRTQQPPTNQQQSQPMCRQYRDSWSCGCSTRWTLEPCPDYYTRWGCQGVIVKDHKSRYYCKRCSADLNCQRNKDRNWHSGQYKYWKYDS
ncbi:hypothetical protein B0T24DRAFT_718857 [Lasiosphaeria ovina]|uniref:Uncharacterized protein n=1 Tax=Lasiosphaeria ovina TaxID=92902 RepID=A0AAE0KH88_9PEZI|nr:hypothetical protein B0T24DRAFT_718857 [Lasiosphaeria ovina]